MLLQRNSSPWQVEDELVERAQSLDKPRQTMPLAEITFFAQKKCYLSEQRRHFSGQNGVFVGADAVYLGGGPVVVYPLAGSSNQRPTLQSDSESRGKRPR